MRQCSCQLTVIVMNMFALCLIILVAPAFANEEPIVTTPFGKIRGSLSESYDGRVYSEFLGIPYAKPPIGNLRFEEPQPVEPWKGIWVANISTECIQINHYFEPEGGNFIGQEDCLYLNIFVPRKNPSEDNLLDVIVHIHSGAFNFGYGYNYAGPKYLMDREVVFVNFNYRLGPLGFLSTEDDVVPGNNGMKDQSAALKWIKENIQYFGGNPNSITITGLSAGSVSVHYHYLSPLSKGLFNKGISASGTVLCPWSIQEKPLSKTRKLASSVGCEQKETRDLIDCLKQRSARQIVENVRQFRPWLYNPFAPFALVVEKTGNNPFLPDEPYKLLKEGKMQDLPWITSVTSEEGLYPAADYALKDHYLDDLEKRWDELAPHVLDYNFTVKCKDKDAISEKIKRYYLKQKPISKDTFGELIQMIGDRHFVVPAETSARMQASINKSPVYFYRFSYLSEKHLTFASYYAPCHKKFGVSHGDDVVFVLSVPGKTPPKMAKIDESTKNLLLDIWVTFAKTSIPTIKGVNWETVSDNIEDPINFLHIRSPYDLKNERLQEMGHRSFWESLPFLENKNLLNYKDEL